MKSHLLIFHRTIAPYRIDFFNDLSEAFDTRVCLQYKNLLNQKFDYDKISSQFKFAPVYLNELCKLKGRVINFGYWKHLDEFQPDIVIVGEFGLDCLLVLLYRFLKRKKYKVVSICDDSYNMVAEDNDFSRIHRMLRKWIVPRLDDLILVEPKVTQWYQLHYRKGVYFPIIKKEEKARKEYEHALQLSNETIRQYHLIGKHIFLFVGRLVALKNVETIIKAFAQLPKDENVLVIVGDGPEREKLHAEAKNSQCNIIFTGRLEGEELNQWYNIATCFILASYQEPFGAVTNEALLAGCNALVSEKAGSACLIANGINGYIFNPRDANGLSVKMKAVNKQVSTVAFLEKLRSSKMLVHHTELHNNIVKHLRNLS